MHGLLSTTKFMQAKHSVIGRISAFGLTAFKLPRAFQPPRQVSRSLYNTALPRSRMPVIRAFARRLGLSHSATVKFRQQNFRRLRFDVRLPAANLTQHQTSPALPLPNMALQPTANGLPGLGLHFILAQTRQPAVCG